MNENKESSIVIEDMKISLYINKIVHDEFRITNAQDHAHSYNELFICTQGNISISTDLGIVELNANDIVIIPTGVMHHKLKSENSAKWNSLAFSLSSVYTRNKSVLWKKLLKICSKKEVTIFKNASEFCTSINSIISLPHYNDPFLPAFKVALMLIELVTVSQDKTAHNSIFLPNNNIAREVALELLLDECYVNDVTNDEIAKKLNISTRQLSRIIKSKYGKTLHQLLIEKRLNTAKNLLLNTDCSIIKIYKKVGFNTSSSFYKKFGERYKMTPTEYRKLNKKN